MDSTASPARFYSVTVKRIRGQAFVAALLVFFLWLSSAAGALARPPTSGESDAGKTVLGSADYINVIEVSRLLGSQLIWKERGRKVILQNGSARAELEADARPAKVNGLRVYLGHRILSSSGQLSVSRIDFERCLTPLLRPGFGVALPSSPKIIAVDAGHGGEDPGTSNPKVHVVEKEAALDVARRLEKRLVELGYKVVMTRTRDVLLGPKSEDLIRRAQIANRAHADLFVSIHFNAVLKDVEATRGVEVYTYAPAHQHSTDSWSESDKDDPDFLTTDQPANRFDHWNTVLAQALHRALLDELKSEDRGKKIMHLGVLRWLKCPAVLVEPAFLTNDAEAARVATPAYREAIAQALASGISHFAAQLESLRAPASPPNEPL